MNPFELKMKSNKQNKNNLTENNSAHIKHYKTFLDKIDRYMDKIEERTMETYYEGNTGDHNSISVLGYITMVRDTINMLHDEFDNNN